MKTLQAVELVLTSLVAVCLVAATASRGLKRFIRAEISPRLDLVEDAVLELLEGAGPRARVLARRIRRQKEERAS